MVFCFSQDTRFNTGFMYYMQVTETFVVFYICNLIILTNIAKIKRSQIKDSLYIHLYKI